MFKLALRNILRHKGRTAMTLSAIVFGVIGLILSGGFVRDVLVQLGEAVIHSQLGHVQIFQKGFYEQGTRSPEKYLIAESTMISEFAAKLPEAEATMSRLNFSGLLSNGKSDWAVVGEGVEADKEAALGSYLQVTEGRMLSDDDRSGILIGDGVAQALDLKPGAQVTMLLNTADGALNTLEFEVVGIFQSFSKDFDSRAVRIALPAAQTLLGREGANSIVLSLRATPDTDYVASLLRGKLAERGYEVKTWIEMSDFYVKTVELYKRQFGILQLIVLVMVLLSVINMVNMSVFERIGEFGTLMALGNTRGYVLRLVMLENVILGLVGACIGLAAGIVLALLISKGGIPMPPPPNSNVGYTASIQLVPSVLALAFVVGIGATVGAALIPAYRVSRTVIVDALRFNI
ncbi:MAG: ABC transporter permease [Methyloversatilis sp.]|nr:ABC transporter permease [Methyloversatilis sp.]